MTAAILLLGFLGLLALGLPVAIALAGSGIIFALVDGSVPLLAIVHRMVGGVNSFPLMCVPFFIMAGSLMNTAGITERIYSFAVALVGWMKGGLGQVNVVGSVIFAGMSGTAVADAAGLGTIEIKAMKDHGYDPRIRRRYHRRVVDSRSAPAAVAADGALRDHRQRLDRPAFRGRHHPRAAPCRMPDVHGRVLRACAGLCTGRQVPLSELWLQTSARSCR